MSDKLTVINAKGALLCPLHDTVPLCERVVLRKKSSKEYIAEDGTKHEYPECEIAYYRLRCKKCSNRRDEFSTQHETMYLSIMLAIGVHSDKKKDAIKEWNSLVGDIQLDRLESAVRTGLEN